MFQAKGCHTTHLSEASLFSMFLLDQVLMAASCFPTRSQLMGPKIWALSLKVPLPRTTSLRARHRPASNCPPSPPQYGHKYTHREGQSWLTPLRQKL